MASLLTVLTVMLAAGSAPAEPLSSTSFQLLTGRPTSASNAALAIPGVSHLGSMGYSLGQGSVTGFSGAIGSLSLTANGFWPVVLGDFSNLDPDGDGIASPFDDDDDGDGLLDIVETGRGIFLSASDTGSSSVNTDTDGDGFDDATEVASGSDPNNAASTPPPTAVPLLDGVGLIFLGGLLAWIGSALKRTETETT